MAIAAAWLDPAQGGAPTPTRHRAPRTGGVGNAAGGHVLARRGV